MATLELSCQKSIAQPRQLQLSYGTGVLLGQHYQNGQFSFNQIISSFPRAISKILFILGSWHHYGRLEAIHRNGFCFRCLNFEARGVCGKEPDLIITPPQMIFKSKENTTFLISFANSFNRYKKLPRIDRLNLSIALFRLDLIWLFLRKPCNFKKIDLQHCTALHSFLCF